ncbi:NAD+ synthase [Pyrofollis japonicus]|uniref:NAD+ synthase n=1 Tax=Pyrofollis japonicus TaxID=3060460 RepID=UPI00295AED86|nr:NAD+ synthase [Pyrofollis japonicus]BEP16998.1 NAD+ synthase [Pyrofollis japonicus]
MALSRISLRDIISLDYESIANRLSEFIRDYVADANAKGVVVGVSGGVDSATTLYLLARSLGADKVLALILPDSEVTPSEDLEDAKLLVEKLGVRHRVIDIKNITNSYLSLLEEADKKTIGNLRARIRMTILYYYANMYGYLVAGTGDRSEILIGYFTKYGDGAADFFPIGCLYKSQVRRLALHLGVPVKIAWKPSSPRLWPGQLAEEELGLKYDEIDLILYALFDLGLGVKEAAEAAGLPIGKVMRVLELYENTRHKRQPPPIPDPTEFVWKFRLQ